MRYRIPADRQWIGGVCALLLAATISHADWKPEHLSVPDTVVTNLQSLFQKYYPKANITNICGGGFHVEHDVMLPEVTPTNITTVGKRFVHQGPRSGGILCHVYLESGKDNDQIFVSPSGSVLDRKEYTEVMLAPYSSKLNAHLWVTLCYPPDASKDFLNGFRKIMVAFVNEGNTNKFVPYVIVLPAWGSADQNITDPVSPIDASKAMTITNGITLGQLFTNFGPGTKASLSGNGTMHWEFTDGRILCVADVSEPDAILSSVLHAQHPFWFVTVKEKK